jgi:hypothetical protein
MAKYGRFKAWLRYSNLNSWQKQKWHWGYVNYAGKEWHCTCGLVVAFDAVARLAVEDDGGNSSSKKRQFAARLTFLMSTDNATTADEGPVLDNLDAWMQPPRQAAAAAAATNTAGAKVVGIQRLTLPGEPTSLLARGGYALALLASSHKEVASRPVALWHVPTAARAAGMGDGECSCVGWVAEQPPGGVDACVVATGHASGSVFVYRLG